MVDAILFYIMLSGIALLILAVIAAGVDSFLTERAYDREDVAYRGALGTARHTLPAGR